MTIHITVYIRFVRLSLHIDEKVNMETGLTVLAAVLLVASHCKSTTLTIDPNPLSISGNAKGSAVNVSVKCSQPATFDTLISLAISRNLTSNLNVSIQIAAATIKNVEARMLKTIPGASVSGSLPKNFIMVTITLMSCNDAGTYRCTAFYLVAVSSVLGSSVDTKKITIQGQTPSPNDSTRSQPIVTGIPTNVRQPDADGVEWWVILVTAIGGVVLCLVIGIVIFITYRDQSADEHRTDEKKDEYKGDVDISSVPPLNAVPTTENYVPLDSVPEKESELANDRESSEDVSEGAIGTSSRGSVSS